MTVKCVVQSFVLLDALKYYNSLLYMFFYYNFFFIKFAVKCASWVICIIMCSKMFKYNITLYYC